MQQLITAVVCGHIPETLPSIANKTVKRSVSIILMVVQGNIMVYCQ